MSTPLDELFALTGRTALVTGASQGIGRMIAAGLARAGVHVYVCARKPEPLAATAAQITAALTAGGGRCTPLPGNVAQEAECLRIGAELAQREEQLDILVNNAGATWLAPIEACDEASWERVLALNVKGVSHLTRAVLPLLRQAGTAEAPARVVNIGSVAGLHAPDLPTYAYAASKAAVHHLTRHLAKALAPAITVNAIAPGTFESRMSAPMLATHGDEVAAATPLQRIGRPDDIVGAVAFLTSRAGAYVTGAVLPLDGGVSSTL